MVETNKACPTTPDATSDRKIQRSCSTGLRLDLGQRVQHAGRGYGTVCQVNYDEDKCYYVRYDDGDMHHYDPIQAGFKFRLVEGTFSGVRLTLSASSLPSMDLLGGADPYALIRRVSDGAVVAKTETVKNARNPTSAKNSLNPTWVPLLVPLTDLLGDGRVSVEVHNASMLKAHQLIGAYELNLLSAVDQFDGMPLMREKDGTSQKRGSLTLRVEGVRESEMPAATISGVVATVRSLADAATKARAREAEADAAFEKLMRARSPRQALAAQQRSRRRSNAGTVEAA